MQPEEQKWTQPSEQPTGAPHYSPQDEATQSQPAEEMDAPEDMVMDEQSAMEGMDEQVSWQATEYIHRHKGTVWYVVFAVVVLGLIAASIFLIKSWTFAILIVVMAAALVVYSMRPPAIHNYTLSRKGLHIDDRLYEYAKFKEFGLIHGDDEHSIMLIPRERFKPGVTIYFPEEAGEGVVDMLAARLPMHEVHLDLIDRLIRRLHI